MTSLEVIFPDGTKAAEVGSSPLMKKEAATSEPKVTWKAGEADKLYTLLCTDPDAPAPNAPWLHWLVINCKGDDPSTGTTVMSWAPPTPPPGSGIHRYQFKLFLQPTTAPIESRSPKGRAAFSSDAFIQSNKLQLLEEREIRVAAQ
jgi:phosphatidylethanolamine-binding protein (PEBP) family uncharacterized protein